MQSLLTEYLVASGSYDRVRHTPATARAEFTGRRYRLRRPGRASR